MTGVDLVASSRGTSSGLGTVVTARLTKVRVWTNLCHIARSCFDRGQENDGRRRHRDNSPRRTGAGTASNIRRERQERLIQQLTSDNGVLQRKVAGYQLALQVRTSRIRTHGS